MKILIVEDDRIQSDLMAVGLRSAFPQSTVNLIETEREFRELLEGMATDPPDVIVMDVMLRWTNPSPEMPRAPEDVREGGHYQAGLRCAALLGRYETTKTIPVILHTILEKADLLHGLHLLGNVHLLTKDSNIDALIDMIRQVTSRPASWQNVSEDC